MGIDLVAALAASAPGGLLPGMLPSFALPFRHHRQAAQPLKPAPGALVEPQWDQPAGRRNLSDCACGAPDAGAICPRGAKAAKGLLPDPAAVRAERLLKIRAEPSPELRIRNRSCRILSHPSTEPYAIRDETAWLGREDSNSEMSSQIISLKSRVDSRRSSRILGSTKAKLESCVSAKHIIEMRGATPIAHEPNQGITKFFDLVIQPIQEHKCRIR
jgi:hypothetical protein